MARPVPQNLAMLRQAFGDGPLFASSDDDVHTIQGVEIVCGYEATSSAERFYIVKEPGFVQAYIDLCEQWKGSTIVELGIAEGGSTALLALVAAPAKLVAVDNEPERLVPLDELLDARGLTDSVRPLFGLDQGDRVGLAASVDRELAGAPIDLVIDDASHDLDLTRSSFETLFPRLRPGGQYLIEDWRMDYIFRDALVQHFRESPDELRADLMAQSAAPAEERDTTPPSRPLSDLAIELVLARASQSHDAIADVTLDGYWISVRRGSGPLDPVEFRLADLYTDYFGYLT